MECSGPGIEPTGVTAGMPTQFKIDTRRAGNAPLDVQVLDDNSNNIDVSLSSNRDGTHTCYYTPKKGSKHIVQVRDLNHEHVDRLFLNRSKSIYCYETRNTSLTTVLSSNILTIWKYVISGYIKAI